MLLFYLLKKAMAVIVFNPPLLFFLRRECFVSYCVHKLRSAFGKSKVVRDAENVLLAFSGGAASTALQHLIQEVSDVRQTLHNLR